MKKQNIKYVFAGLISLLVSAVYLPALRNNFVDDWDDLDYILENPYIRSLDLNFFKWAFFDFYAANWHPLTWISHALDYAVWELNPLGHHLTNNILHAVNTFLVVLLVVRLLEAASNGSTLDKRGGSLSTIHSPFTLVAAGVTGLLFGLHPLHVESVAWVAERKDMLCALFFLLSIMAYVKYATTTAFNQETEFHHRGTETQRESKTQISNSPFSVPLRLCGPFPLHKYYLSALCFFILALMSKPMAVSLPLILLILDWYPFERITSSKIFRTVLIEKVPFLALSIASSIVTILAQNASGAIRSTEIIPLSLRVVVAAHSLIAYLWKMIVPIGLIPYYPYPNYVALFSLEYLATTLVAVAITVACIVMARKQNKLFLSVWACYVATLVPVLGIVQAGGQSMADRYTYLPGIGPFLILGVLIAWLWERLRRVTPVIKYFGAATAMFLLLFISFLTYKQMQVWKNSYSLWTYMIEKGPSNVAFAYNNRGIAFGRLNQPEKAIEDFGRAMAVDPNDSKPYYNRGLAFEKKGQLDKAVADYSKAISLNPSYFEAYYRRGLVFEQEDHPDKAFSDFDKAVALYPSHLESRIRLGILYGKSGSFEKAIEHFSKTIDINPNYPLAYSNRGFAYSLTGQYDKALIDLSKAIELNKYYAVAYFNRGHVYMKVNSRELAFSDFQRACDLGSGQGCDALKSLAAQAEAIRR